MNDFRAKHESLGTLAPLFDMSFNAFITLSALKVIYLIFLVLEALGLLFVIVTGFANGFLTGLGVLVVAPLFWLLVVILTRMYLELVAVVFRIAHNTTILATAAEER